MSKFLDRTIERIDRLDHAQLVTLVRKLTKQGEHLRRVLFSLPMSILVTTMDHRLAFSNAAARRLLPLFNEQSRRREKVWTLMKGNGNLARLTREMLESQDNSDQRECLVYQGTQEFLLSLRLFPLVREGHIEGNLLYIEDITAKKREESKLRRAESLASLTTLAAGVAHEIKNPLASMGIHVQLMGKLLKGDTKGHSSEIFVNYLSILKEEIERLNSIVVDFLSAVRPMDLHLEVDSVNDIIQNLTHFITPELKERRVLLSLNLSSEEIPVYLDKRYIKQALLNIITNALAAMESSKEGVLMISTSSEEDHLRITIGDTGCGIPSEIREKIFEPYFSTKENGSGLGLTLVYKIIREHNGTLHIHSEPQKGTIVTIELPIARGERRLLSWQGDAP